MTKLLLCLDCGDLITPYQTEPRICYCKRHACWWNDHMFVVYDFQRHECPDELKPTCNYKPNHRIIGIHNEILSMWNNPNQTGLYKDRIEKMLNETPSYYLFKSWNSPIVVIEVGVSSDCRWADYKLDKINWDKIVSQVSK